MAKTHKALPVFITGYLLLGLVVKAAVVGLLVVSLFNKFL